MTWRELGGMAGRFKVMAAQGLSAVFSDIKGNEATVKAVECAVKFALGAVLGAAEIFGGSLPFGPGFTAACGSGLGGLFALIGAMLGSVMRAGFTGAMKYCAISVLIYSAAFVFRDAGLVRRKWFMPAIAAFMTACTGFVYASDGGWPLQATAIYITEIILIGGSAYFYAEAINSHDTGTDEPLIRRWSLLICGATALITLSLFKIFDIISLGRIAAVTAVIVTARKGGAGAGAVTGAALGLSMDAAASSAPFFTVSYALAGMVSGIFSGGMRVVSAAAYILANAAGGIWGGAGTLLMPLLYETFAGSVIFMVLPPSLLLEVKERIVGRESFEGAQRSREYVRRKAQDAALAFREIYDEMRRILPDNINDNDISTVFDLAAEAVCRKCPRAGICWKKEYGKTQNALNDATAAMIKNGKLTAEDIPGYFSGACVDMRGLLSVINAEYKAMQQRRVFRNRLKESRKNFFDQYLDIEAVIKGIAGELDASKCAETEVESRLKLYLRGVGADISGGVFRDSNNRMHIELEGSGIMDLRRDSKYLEKISAAVGTRLCEDTDRSKRSRLFLLEAEPLAASVGIAALRRPGQGISGDSNTNFKTEEGVLCVLLSDGMGSGEGAAKESAGTLRILERFIKAGVSPLVSLKLMSSAMLAKNEECMSYATVDLMCVNLFTGETELFKYGAAPSYIKKGGEVRRVTGESFAERLGAASAPGCTRLMLEPDTVAVIASDGVTDGRGDEWLRRAIGEAGDETPRALARSILEKATVFTGREDDMTVITVTVKQRS